MINRLTYSEEGLKFTTQWEGLNLHAYQDTGGVWTIGVGHTGPEVVPGLTITHERANELLQLDTASAADCVNKNVTAELEQCEFDALVDFVYNIGCGAFKTSTLLRLLNADDFTNAADQFTVWVYDNGKVIQGLVNRRAAEKALFLGEEK